MEYQEYPKWITTLAGEKRIVENRAEEDAWTLPPPEPKPPKRGKKDDPDDDTA